MKREEAFRYRWVYVAQNLQVRENVEKVVSLMKRAKSAGYNGIVLADYKLGILDRVPEHYFSNAAEVKRTADALGLAIYPTVMSCGYDSALLAHDPNLAEGLPVVEAPFMVKNGAADIEARNLLDDSWTFKDASAMDGTAIKFTDLRGANGRAMRELSVKPFRQFHLQVTIKTQNLAGGEVRCTVLGDGANPRSLCHNNWQIKPTQDATVYHAVFNSLDNAKIRVYLGCWGGQTGSFWLDDISLTEVGLLNVLRRDGCLLSVVGEDGTRFTEGRDFAPVKDEKMGNVPWPGEFEVWHAPPKISIPSGSRIQDGQRLKVSFFHAVCVYDNQVAASLVDPKVFALHRAQVARVRKLLAPPGYFLSHDELRVANWSADCRAKNASAGKLLAEHAARCAAIVRATDPKAERFFWSDMFDPHHNATDNYYLVRGTLAGSWEGLPKDAVIVNWNSGKPEQSLKFFAGRGHRQILAGYYDGPVENIKSWLASAKKLPKNALVDGVMYTTWRADYSNLEAFAKAAWG